MIEWIGPGRSDIWMRRLVLCFAAALGTTAASWVNPPPLSQGLTAAPAPRPVPVPRAGTVHAANRQSGGGFVSSSLAVTQWGFRSGDGEDIAASGHAPAGRPLTLWLTLDGNAAAVDRIRTRGSMAIEVHWQRRSDATPGAPDLVTRLAIGHPGLADSLAAEVRRMGFFEWHSWARKTSLSPGTWSVSLTYPDGRPLACGDPPAPCRFRITVG